MAIKGKVNHAVQIWCKAISGYTPNEIQSGIKAAEELLSPPNLGKFKQLCRPPRPKQNGSAYQQFNRNNHISLLNLPTNTIIGKAEMRLIKITEGEKVQDFDDETELQMHNYYLIRQVNPCDHESVKEFLCNEKHVL